MKVVHRLVPSFKVPEEEADFDWRRAERCTVRSLPRAVSAGPLRRLCHRGAAERMDPCRVARAHRASAGVQAVRVVLHRRATARTISVAKQLTGVEQLSNGKLRVEKPVPRDRTHSGPSREG